MDALRSLVNFLPQFKHLEGSPGIERTFTPWLQILGLIDGADPWADFKTVLMKADSMLKNAKEYSKHLKDKKEDEEDFESSSFDSSPMRPKEGMQAPTIKYKLTPTRDSLYAAIEKFKSFLIGLKPEQKKEM